MTFPYKDCGNQINGATEGLYILDNRFFKFQDKGDELCEMPIHTITSSASYRKMPYQSVIVNYLSFKSLKEDLESESYNLWLNDIHMNFLSQWLARNIGSECVMASKVIDTMVTVSAQRFFEKDFTNASVNLSVPDVNMHVIHST